MEMYNALIPSQKFCKLDCYRTFNINTPNPIDIDPIIPHLLLISLLSLCSLSLKMSYRQISWSLESARLDVIMIVSISNFTGVSVRSAATEVPV